MAMKKGFLLCLFLLLATFSFAQPKTSFILGSPVFEPERFIPKKYSCDGADVSPALFWQNPPPKSKSFVLLIVDLDVPDGDWVHWIVFNLPSQARHLTEGVLPPGAIEGKNSWGTVGYKGPCPPAGDDIHRYLFKLYALDNLLALDSKATQKDVLHALKNHVLAITQFIADYHRD
jgi:Raf kinase inhibitor-like YbhB/YbcL family protein